MFCFESDNWTTQAAGSTSAASEENQGPVSDPGEPDLGSSDPLAEKTVATDVPVMENSPEDDEVLATPTLAGERSKAGKKRANAPWAKLLSQYPQVSLVASLSVLCIHV